MKNNILFTCLMLVLVTMSSCDEESTSYTHTPSQKPCINANELHEIYQASMGYVTSHRHPSTLSNYDGAYSNTFNEKARYIKWNVLPILRDCDATLVELAEQYQTMIDDTMEQQVKDHKKMRQIGYEALEKAYSN